MRNGQKPSSQVDVSRYLGLGLTLVLSTLLFLYLGTLADKWLRTDPALTVIGAFVGAAGGFYHMYRQLVQDQKHRNDGPPKA